MAAALLVVLVAAGCADDGDDAGATTTAPPETDTFEGIGAGDEAGDAQPLLAFDADAGSLLAADLVGANLLSFDGELTVTWKLAPGAIAAADEGGNQLVSVEIGPGDYPSADISVARSAGREPVVTVTTRAEPGDLVEEVDPAGSRVEVDGDTIEAVVPTDLLADLFPGAWEWSCTSTFSRTGDVPGSQLTGQDACGSTEAGAGSEIVTFDGVDLS